MPVVASYIHKCADDVTHHTAQKGIGGDVEIKIREFAGPVGFKNVSNRDLALGRLSETTEIMNANQITGGLDSWLLHQDQDLVPRRNGLVRVNGWAKGPPGNDTYA